MDIFNKYILEINETLDCSPIRKLLKDRQIIPFEKSMTHNLKTIEEELNIIKNKNLAPINVVIVGEVKSGKSTLINAIVQEEVSKVDALEATLNIVQISYGEKTNEIKENNVVNIKMPIRYLKKINIVDTPGIRTITKQNEAITMKYIQNADIILYNFDATHLGQEDITDMLEKIFLYGKPIIGILNKSDLTDVSVDELINYANGEYGIYIDKFFAISAYLEFQNIIDRKNMSDEVSREEQSYGILKDNFDRLNEYIQDVYENHEKIQSQSIESSINSLMHKDMVNHYEYLKSISMLNEESKQYENLLISKGNIINSKLKSDIEEWLENDFLIKEIELIKENIEDAYKYINEKYINDLIQNKKSDFDKVFTSEWEVALKEVKDKMREGSEGFVGNTSYNNTLIDTPILDISSSKNDLQGVLTTVGTGAVIGGAAGSIIAVYSSTIGTSAASMALLPALATYCPPLLVAGTISGGIGKMIFDKMKKDEKSREIINDIDLYRENLKYSINEVMDEAYKNSSRDIIYTNKDMYENTKGIMLNKYEVENITIQLKEYIEKIKATIRE